MVIRARPKYLANDFYADLEDEVMPQQDELFFNLGRSALKFFLQNYSLYLKKQVLITMQSFNCTVVIEAALQADCKIILLDISTYDFSITLEEIKNPGLPSSAHFKAQTLTGYGDPAVCTLCVSSDTCDECAWRVLTNHVCYDNRKNGSMDFIYLPSKNMEDPS